MKDCFYTLIGLSCLFAGCVNNYDAPCRDQVIANAYVFSAEQAGVIPYTDHDTLVYAAGTDDTLYFSTSTYLDSVTVNLAGTPNNPECPNDFESHAVLNVTLADFNASFPLYYKAWQQTGLCSFEAGTEKLQIPLAAIGSIDSTFMDSVELGNTMYYQVNRFLNSSGTAFYIHPTLGLLQFSKDSRNYTLQRFNSKPWK